MRKPLAALLGSGLLLAAGAASAQQYGYSGSYSPGMPPPSASGVDNIGQGGQLVLGVERITGIFMQTDKSSTPAGDQSYKDTGLSLLGTGQPATPSSVPRVAADYFVVDSISVGGSIMYWSDSQTADPASPLHTDTLHMFLFNPRVGYAYVIDDTFSIWPRLGFMYARGSNDAGKSTRTDVTVDAMLGISPVKHVVFLLGPMLDLGLGGSQDFPNGTGGTQSIDTKLTTFGLTAGMGAYFP